MLEGRVGVRIGEETFVAGPGTLVCKPRGVPHAFWNAGDEPARLLEIISPAGFEQYFPEMAALFAMGEPDPARSAEIWQRYGLEMEPASVARLIAENGLHVPARVGPPARRRSWGDGRRALSRPACRCRRAAPRPARGRAGRR